MSDPPESGQRPAPLAMAKRNAQRLSKMESALEEITETIRDQEHEVETLKRDLSHLSQDIAKEGGPLWRRGKYLESLINDAGRNPGNAAELEVSEAHDLVNRIVERPQIYEDFADIEEEVENGRLPAEFRYVREDRSSPRNSRLELQDVTTLELPSQYGSVRLSGDR